MNDGFSMVDALVAIAVTGLALLLLVPLFNLLVIGIPQRQAGMRNAVSSVNLYRHLGLLAEAVNVPYWSDPVPDGEHQSIRLGTGETVFMSSDIGIVDIVQEDVRTRYRIDDDISLEYAIDGRSGRYGFLLWFASNDSVMIPFHEQAARSPNVE